MTLIMHLIRSLSLIFFCCPLLVTSQTLITGKVSNDQGQPLPYTTIYQEGTTNGTTSNADGRYQLQLPAGTNTVVAQHIGYKRKSQSVNSSGDRTTTLHFVLQPESLVLDEVVINADQKDPARQVIRNAIKKRKYYANEVAAYRCEVYIKGLQRLDEKPSLLGMTVSVDTGIVYLSESVSRLKFMQPDKMNETMISSKVSGKNNAFSYNQASEMMFNLYENSFFVEGLSQRPLISPIANSAFLYYDYELAGVMIENDRYINKIKIIPKRKTDPVFSGYIYIIEDSWRIHSVDVNLTKANGIEFIDSLTFNQVFAPVGFDIWMPISQRFTFQFKAYGFKGSGHFTSIYKNYEVEPNYWQPREPKKETTKTPVDQKPRKALKKPSPMFDEEEFSNAVVKVEENANERDSIYWATVRPIPLTPIEVRDYQVKDSISVVKESKPYIDSLDQVKNKFKISNLLFSSYTYHNSHRKRYIDFPTLQNGLLYNTVEGLVTNLEFHYRKRSENEMNYQLSPTIRYGFSNNKIQAKLEGVKMLDRKSRSYLHGAFGRYIYQLNEEEPISPWTNTFFSLLQGRNYVRLYQKGFAQIGFRKELVNGLQINTSLHYENRVFLENTARFNLFDQTINSNTPVNLEEPVIDQSRHQAILFHLQLRIQFDQQYIDRPDRKIILSSKYPEFKIDYKKGLSMLGSDVNYDLLKIGTAYKWRMGQLGESRLSSWAGTFLNNREIYFQDFQHFNGNQIYLRKMSGSNLFQLLDFYRYSTQESFLQGHYEHHFNEFIFNKIPLIKHLNFQAVASVNYLTTPTAGNYFEFGAGIEHIFKFFRVDFFTAVQNGSSAGSGIRVGIGF